MRQLLFLFGIIFCGIIQLGAQEATIVEGVVSDVKNQQPLPFASIFLKDYHLGTVTDEHGHFRIAIPPAQMTGTLQFSYVGYEMKELPLVGITDFQQLKVGLAVKATVLDAAIVRAPNKRLTAKQLLRKALSQIETNYATNPVRLEAYYRETVTENGRYVKFADAVCDYHYVPYQNKQLKLWEYDSRWRTTGVRKAITSNWGERLHRGHFESGTALGDQVRIRASRYSDNLSERPLECNIEGGPLGLLGKDRVKFKAYFMDKNNFYKFHYTLTEELDPVDNRWKYVVHFAPKRNIGLIARTSHMWNNGAQILTGKIFIDRNSFAFTGIEYQVQQHSKKHLCSFTTMAYKHFDYHVRIDYAEQGGKWYLKHLRLEDEFIFEDTATQIVTPYRSVSEVFVTAVNTVNVNPFPVAETLPNWDGNQLFDYRVTGDAIFWENYAEAQPAFRIPQAIREDIDGHLMNDRCWVNKSVRKSLHRISTAEYTGR